MKIENNGYLLDTYIKPRKIEKKRRQINGERHLYLILSPEDMDFWGGQPPLRIDLMTASGRKAEMYRRILYGFTFPGEHNPNNSEFSREMVRTISNTPTELQDWFDKNVPNGNGKLKKEILLGYFHGVPVYAKPQKSEGKSNSVVQEAANKAFGTQDTTKKRKKMNRVAIGLDAGEIVGDSKELLGKPMSSADFPRRNEFGLESEEEYQQRLDLFLEKYKHGNFRIGKILRNINGVAVIDWLDQDLLYCMESIISMEISEKIKELKLKIDCAGGGVSQQLLEWENTAEELMLQIEQELSLGVQKGMDERVEAAERFGDIVNKWLIFCQITGMPFVAIDICLTALAEERKRKLSR